MRDQLRNIVAWIEHDPLKALQEIAEAEAQQNKAAASLLATNEAPQCHQLPPPLDLHVTPSDDHVPSSSLPASIPLSSTYPDSPPPPPSPPDPGFTSELSSFLGGKDSAGTFEGEEDSADELEEEEEDEEFPASFGAPPPAWDEQEKTFNAQASGQALNAFLDDGSNSEEDEPLPVGASTDKTEDQEEHDEPFPVASHSNTGAEIHVSRKAEESTESTASEPIEIDDDETDDTLDHCRSLPEEESTIAGHEQVERLSFLRKESNQSQYHETIDSPHDSFPSSPPPSPPPISPPPPPPPLSLPLSDLPDDQHRPSSPAIIMPQSPRIPLPTISDSKETKEWDPIDYSRFRPYVAMAQRINGCLEKLAEVRICALC